MIKRVTGKDFLTLTEPKAVMVCIDSFKLQTMTALIKSFCGGVQGGQFFQKAPPLVDFL
jgi:hypothetical protein